MSVQTAPERTVAYYNRLIIWAALLCISLGLFSQSLHVNIFTQQSLDTDYADAIAAQLAIGLSLKVQESQNQLTNAATHPSTRSYLEQQDSTWRSTLLTLINGANKIHILDRRSTRSIGTAMGSKARRLALDVMQGKDIPLSVLEHQQQKRYVGMAAIKDQNATIIGVLIVEYSSAWIAQLQQEVAPQRGFIELIQVLPGNQQPELLFSHGTQPESFDAISSHSINDQWVLTYTPDETRPQLSLAPMIAPWVIALLATLASLGWFAWAQNGAIRQNQFLLVTYVRGLFRNQKDQRPDFTIKLFHELADSMAELAKSKGMKVTSPVQQASELASKNKAPDSNAKKATGNDAASRASTDTSSGKSANFEYRHTAPQLEVEEVEH